MKVNEVQRKWAENHPCLAIQKNFLLMIFSKTINASIIRKIYRIKFKPLKILDTKKMKS